MCTKKEEEGVGRWVMRGWQHDCINERGELASNIKATLSRIIPEQNHFTLGFVR